MTALLALLVLAEGPATPAPRPDRDPRIVKLLEAVSEDRLATILRKLVSFETRHTLSAIDTPGRGIGAARQWILDEMTRSSPRLQTGFDSYDIPPQGDRITRDVE